jgi:hypothetical protein
MQQQWSAVDNFMISSLIPDDDVLQQVLENNKRAGLPNMMSRQSGAAAGAVRAYDAGKTHS